MKTRRMLPIEPIGPRRLASRACFCWLAGCGGCRDSKTTDESTGDATTRSRRPSARRHAPLCDRQSQRPGGVQFRRFPPGNPRTVQPGTTRRSPTSTSTPCWRPGREPEMFRQVVDQLNQWVRSQPPPADWKLDPMTAALPKPLRELPQVKNLGKMEFSPFDGFALQEAAWLRDVSLSARGDVVDDLDRARNLFDWTVRNIQLEPDRPDRIPQLPRETLLFGRGTASERAWVFILLLRQLDIDAAVLAIDEGQRGEGEGRGERPREGWALQCPVTLSPQQENREPPASLVRRRADRGRSLPVRSLARAADSRPERRDARRNRPIGDPAGHVGPGRRRRQVAAAPGSRPVASVWRQVASISSRSRRCWRRRRPIWPSR